MPSFSSSAAAPGVRTHENLGSSPVLAAGPTAWAARVAGQPDGSCDGQCHDYRVALYREANADALITGGADFTDLTGELVVMTPAEMLARRWTPAWRA